MDEETGIELDGIVAYRYVEKGRVVLGGEDYDMQWYICSNHTLRTLQ